MGTIVFDRTNLPRNRCQEFRSIAKIEDGQLFHSKLDKFAIYRYERDEEQVAITLNQNIKTCGRVLYRTGIPEIHIMLVEANEQFLENEKLKLMEFEEGVIFEAELRGAMNSLELSTDELYKDINFRICDIQRQQIITSQAMLRENMEILKDNKGRTLYGHVTGEAVIIHKCGTKMVKPRRNEKRCCHELPIWMGDDFKTPAFMKPVSREVSTICTPRICNSFDNPLFNIRSSTLQKWIKIEEGEIRRTNSPQEFIPASHSKEEQIVTKENDIFSQKQKAEFKRFTLVQNTRQLLKEEIIHRMYPAEVLSE